MKSEVRSQKSEASYRLAEHGFEILPDFLSQFECDSLTEELSVCYENQRIAAGSKIGGVRNLLQFNSVASLASSQRIKSVLEDRLGKKVFPVRALFFDKNPEVNWRVPWHQDLSIAIKQRIETDGFFAWSVKDGVVHVQPPQNILDGMVTVRLHLDDCHAENGALKVVPGSHRAGKLSAKQITEWASREAVVCEAMKGAALLMRPLLLHASSPSEDPTHRRILHIEYASDELPNGLSWFNCQ